MIPNDLKADEVVAAFEKAGGVRRQQKGSHISLKMPNGQLVTIPKHDKVKFGLLKAAVRKSGLTEDEFCRLIGR